jgi:hypothetical protein
MRTYQLQTEKKEIIVREKMEDNNTSYDRRSKEHATKKKKKRTSTFDGCFSDLAYLDYITNLIRLNE